MACTSPVRLYRSKKGPGTNGKWPLKGLSQGDPSKLELVPCGRCIHCRLERSRQWAIRCVHESQMHKDNSFITLTYRDEELVTGGFVRPSLYPRHLQLFMKRLRKEYGNGIRFFACGEYGERFNRPHYHACIFGLDFEDKAFYNSKGGNNMYTSNSLDRIWSHGSCIIGDVTFESAAYVARYIMGKHLGATADYYEQHGIEPEFVRMSRRPGIGTPWLEKYGKDVFPNDMVVVRGGIKCKPPRFYSNKYNFATPLDNPVDMGYIAERRKEEAMEHAEYNVRRLNAKNTVKEAQVSNLKRNL
jgi:hypothetical protein